ncbi:hypothetical protein [Achromobacter denitrificans]|uniref:Uncharacterized protein n=1 Tax=Achromobacter denitrificans TaxID=32002 RepID=A0ABZ3G9I6_ACHDE|nr:hypothetical protein [Achromobacter denitrificans]CAB3861229.1 hypothetical protein LMG1860_03341 [Achromobacter denitrificans]
MPNTDTTLIDRAESPLKAVAKRFEGCVPQSFKDFPRGARSLRAAEEHIPGDTTTPSAPGAVWIGSGDA